MPDFTIHNHGVLSYLTFWIFEKYGLKHGVFMRHGGVSPKPWSSLNMATSVGDSRENVLENRARITQCLEVPPSSIYDLWQVHSKVVVKADRPRSIEEKHIRADAIVTDKNGIVLLMLFADCVPILFYDPEKDAAGIAHAGWQGTLKNIAGAVVSAFVEKFGSDPADIEVVIGPAICQDHYEVGEDVVRLAKALFKRECNVITESSGKYYLNLVEANRILLHNAGIQSVETSDICTACRKEDWFSHRGENGRTGRFAAIISLDRYGR